MLRFRPFVPKIPRGGSAHSDPPQGNRSGHVRGVITSLRSIKIAVSTGRHRQCGLWTVPVLLPTYAVGLSIVQVLVVTKNLPLELAQDEPGLVFGCMPQAHTHISPNSRRISYTCKLPQLRLRTPHKHPIIARHVEDLP